MNILVTLMDRFSFAPSIVSVWTDSRVCISNDNSGYAKR